MIPEDKLQELKSRVPIEEVIGRYVGLRQAGRNFKALCPFHGEKTPSFHVYPATRGYHCFGCGANGDAIRFVREIEGIGFVEAVRRLAAQYGISLGNVAADAKLNAQEAEREQAQRIMAAAAAHYRALLWDDRLGAAARDYLKERSINRTLAERFQLGYAPAPEQAGWDVLAQELSRRSLSLDLAEGLGLLARNDRTRERYDRFRGRVMFPISMAGGTVCAFSGRVLPVYATASDGQIAPKYINSPETMLYRKGRSLYGIHAAVAGFRRSGRAILVEGNVDVLRLHELGFDETVAPLGTAVTGEQCTLLSRFVQQVVLCFDGDSAGAQAARKATKPLMEVGIEVLVAPLPPGEDPDTADPTRLTALLNRPRPSIEWILERMVAAGASESIESRARALRAVMPLLKLVKHRDARGDYAAFAGNLLGVPLRRIWAALGEDVADRRSHRHGPVRDDRSTSADRPLPAGQATLTALLVDLPQLSVKAHRAGALEHVDDPRLQPILARVIDSTQRGELQEIDAGALLQLVDDRSRRLVSDAVFSGRFIDLEDPEVVLEQALTRCRLDELEREVEILEGEMRAARSRGDEAALREIVQRRVELRRHQSELRTSLTRASGLQS